MSFDRQALPEPASYFENAGLILQGRGTWRTTTCHFHGGRTTMRVNIKSGAWVCMSSLCSSADRIDRPERLIEREPCCSNFL
jgi:hypothetical protein